MALIRKTAAGSDSYGHVWPEDGAIVEINDAEQIASLMAIPDGGFSEVTPGGGDSDAKTEISEIDPDAPATEPEARTPAKKTAARKTSASTPVQE